MHDVIYTEAEECKQTEGTGKAPIHLALRETEGRIFTILSSAVFSSSFLARVPASESQHCGINEHTSDYGNNRPHISVETTAVSKA